LLEVQLVDAADSTTYDAHDTDDALKLGLVTIDQMSELAMIKESISYVRQNYTALDEDFMRQAVVHRLLERQVTSLISHCAGQLKDHRFESYAEAMESSFLIEHADELAEQKTELEAFLYQNVYRHPDLIKIREQAQGRLKEMFERYCQNPELFPLKYQTRAQKIGVPRMAVEYLAGMTDRFCEDSYHAMFKKS